MQFVMNVKLKILKVSDTNAQFVKILISVKSVSLPQPMIIHSWKSNIQDKLH